MSTIRALIVGVSEYSKIKQPNLPFCMNDIQAIYEAFVDGLKVEPKNIITIGDKGTVLKNEFDTALQSLAVSSSENDTLLFYFSGHGSTLPTGHHLIMSDSCINTQDIITYLELIPAKNKIIFIDSCMSGNFDINQTAIFNINDTVNEFAGKGYAVFASCSAQKYSYKHPNKPISLYTSFLCESIKDIYIIREGKKSLYDIKKLLHLYLEIWNKNNLSRRQNPIFKANMGGTIFFEVDEFHPYNVKKFYEETEQYIIYSVEDSHASSKRYSVEVILKYPFSINELALVNLEIIDKIKDLDIYDNKISEQCWSGKTANIIFCFFGRDETDIVNHNYLCRTVWTDNNQEKDYWYKTDKNSEIINNIHFTFCSYYDNLKIFIQQNTGDLKKLKADIEKIIRKLSTLAEKVIGLYNEFLNEAYDEDWLVNSLSPHIKEIDKYYFEETELDIAPIELKEWRQCCSELSAIIHNFTLFYDAKYLSKRTSDNRKACMDMTIKDYYNHLEDLKKSEIKI